MKKNNLIGIIGLGYVGLPLALAFSKKYQVVGYDHNNERVLELKKGIDSNNENSLKNKEIKRILFSSETENLKNCNIFIITVPTPVKHNNLPDLNLLSLACKKIGKFLKKNSIVIIESTVYPGCTEDFCVPILEKISKLRFNKDFFCGYSPERINPGDKQHTLEKIIKIVSGSDSKTTQKVKQLYKSIVKKVYVAKTIKIAESAKVIENIQRDINIAFVNEVALILKKINVDPGSVLKAASTKWNFLKFNPGLVGGHCIGVDPYYFTYISKKFGYNPKIILAGRKLNNNMAKFVFNEIKSLALKFFKNKKIKILVLGFAFKENIADTRNSQIIKIIELLGKQIFQIYVHDPNVKKKFKFKNKKIKLLKKLNKKNFFDCVFIGTPHKEIINMGGKRIKSFCKKKSFIYDLKSSIQKQYIDGSLY